MLKYGERVRETTNTTGLGDYTLDGEPLGYLPFSNALSTNDICKYTITDGTFWESGIGVLSSSTTLQRLVVIISSSNTDPIDWDAGTKNIFLTPNADDFSAMDEFFYGDGSDGDVTISGATSLTRDMFYNNLTLGVGCSIDENGYRIFVNGVLDAENAPINAIHNNGANAGNATSSTGGTAGTFQAANTIGGGGNGTAGGNGGTAAGSQAAAVGAQNPSNGGSGGTSGAGGSGSGGAGGATRAGGVASNPTTIRRFDPYLFRNLQIQGGAAGAGGGGGGGDGTAGGGGGGGAGAGGGVWVSARIIKRGASTAAGAISTRGGIGGNGFAPTAGNRGGGGGGSGAGGGFIVLYYGHLVGTTATNMLQSVGGKGGDGANGFGTGLGGDGGNGGDSGQLNAISLSGGTKSQSNGGSGTAGALNVGITGGLGGAGHTNSLSL